LKESINKILKVFAGLSLVIMMSACSDDSIIYESSGDLESPYKIKLHEVKIVSETDDNLTLDFIYTYEHETPADEIKLFILPDHGYWRMSSVKITKGKNGARAVIGLSNSNMDKDNVIESDTTTLRFRFDHYLPKTYMGNIWGQDVMFNKKWIKK